MYAFLLASEFRAKQNIRIISIGEGTKPIKKLDPTDMNAIMWLDQIETLLSNVEISTHDFFSHHLATEYLRIDEETEYVPENNARDVLDKLYEFGM